jgi:phosphoesterase RecJ-like protein
MEKTVSSQINERLKKAKDILIVSHVRPDGDAIGSLIGLGLALQDAGKRVRMVLADGVSSSFRHLEGSQLVQTRPEGEFDTFITVDCADFKRLGQPFEGFRKPDINIDHHITNENFGELNLIEDEQVATASILADHLPAWGLQISTPVAAALLTGIVTDTLGFRTSNMTPRAMQQAATLMEAGVDLSDLYMRSLVRRSFASARYWGAGLSSLDSKDGIVWGTLTMADRKKAGYGGNDDADLINIISAIDDNMVGMIFVEQSERRVKISWRALQPDVDVSRVAKHFGGGGHMAAAGADIEGEIDEVKATVLAKTRELLGL